MNNPDNYNEFKNFIEKYNCGIKRNTSIKINGKNVKISNKVFLVKSNYQIITVNFTEEKNMKEFLLLLKIVCEIYGDLDFNLDQVKPKTRKKIDLDDVDWREMPSFIQNEYNNLLKIKLYIPNDEKFKLILMEKINQKVTDKTKSIFFPEKK